MNLREQLLSAREWATDNLQLSRRIVAEIGGAKPAEAADEPLSGAGALTDIASELIRLLQLAQEDLQDARNQLSIPEDLPKVAAEPQR